MSIDYKELVEDLNNLNEDELNIYIGKITKAYLDAESIYYEYQILYDDLQDFLKQKSKNKYNKIYILTSIFQKLLISESSKTAIAEQSNISIENYEELKKLGKNLTEVLEKNTENNTIDETNHVLKLNKLQREQATSKLCNTGEVGVIKRAAETSSAFCRDKEYNQK